MDGAEEDTCVWPPFWWVLVRVPLQQQRAQPRSLLLRVEPIDFAELFLQSLSTLVVPAIRFSLCGGNASSTLGKDVLSPALASKAWTKVTLPFASFFEGMARPPDSQQVDGLGSHSAPTLHSNRARVSLMACGERVDCVSCRSTA